MRVSASPQPRSRGRPYVSCASSTCFFPSIEVARCAKMSRIRIVRSMTFVGRPPEDLLFQVAQLRRRELLVEHDGVGLRLSDLLDDLRDLAASR